MRQGMMRIDDKADDDGTDDKAGDDEDRRQGRE